MQECTALVRRNKVSSPLKGITKRDIHKVWGEKSLHTSLDRHTVAAFALAGCVRCRHGSCVILSTVQTCHITLVCVGAALVLVAVCTHGPHCVILSSPALLPGHGGHVVAAAQTRVELLRNAWH